jgi:hypothetical protein
MIYKPEKTARLYYVLFVKADLIFLDTITTTNTTCMQNANQI